MKPPGHVKLRTRLLRRGSCAKIFRINFQTPRTACGVPLRWGTRDRRSRSRQLSLHRILLRSLCHYNRTEPLALCCCCRYFFSGKVGGLRGGQGLRAEGPGGGGALWVALSLTWHQQLLSPLPPPCLPVLVWVWSGWPICRGKKVYSI